MGHTDGSTLDFERSLAECMRSLVPDFEDDPAAERPDDAGVVIDLHRPQRRRNRPLLLASAIGIASAAAAAVVLLVAPGDRDRTLTAAKHTTAPATVVGPCGTGLRVTSGRFQAGASPTVSLSLRNPGAACSLRAMPTVSIDSDDSAPQATFHLIVRPDDSRSRLPATIPAHGTATFRIDFVRLSSSRAQPAHLTVTVGAAPALRTPLRKTETFGVVPKALVFTGVTKG